MTNSLMFVIAPEGNNVTLSVRGIQSPPAMMRANIRSYNQPVVLKNVSATLVDGSGVGDVITANIHVLGGMTWNGGTLDITNTAQKFVYAFSPRRPSGGASGDLAQHLSVGGFSLDITQAIGAGGVPIVVSPAKSWGWSSTVVAHAVMMGLAWVGALPTGAIIIRFLDKKVNQPVLIHQILQLSTAGLISIAFFVGVGASKGQHFQFAHQWLGLLLFLLLICQGGIGFYHHQRFKKDQPITRRWFTHVHLWLGRTLLFLALINIGLGIQLYGAGVGAQAAWYLFTIALVVAYAFAYWHQFIRNRKRALDKFDPSQFEDSGADDNPQKYEPVRPVAITDTHLGGTYRSDFFDQASTDEVGAKRNPVPTVTAVGRPTTASVSQGNRRYDLPPQNIPGPYSTEPLRTSNVSSQERYTDTYQEPQQTRPVTGARALGARPQTGRPQTGRPPTGRARQVYYSSMDDDEYLMLPYRPGGSV
jgi:Eukaryotic cytochrome b561